MVALLGAAQETAHAQPQPVATMTAPPDALVGEDFQFALTFANAAGSPVGFGPFIDVAVNYGGADDNANMPPNGPPGPCDGINFVKAEMVGVNPSPLALTTVTIGPSGCGATSATHPYSGAGSVSFPAGWQVTTIELPFGSFEADQPPIDVAITAHMHDHADAGAPLEICTRGGFRFGALATGGPLILQTKGPADMWTCAKVSPQVFTVGKAYSGRENETATGPNFVESYKIALDIAAGQTVGNANDPLTVEDCLPDGMVYLANQTPDVKAPAAWGTHVVTAPTASNDNCLTVTWPNPALGAPGADATITFSFWIKEKLRNGAYILADNCAPRLFNNAIEATAAWDPIDGRDGDTKLAYENAKAHTLAAKCLPIQKSVAISKDEGHAGYTPGDTLQYTLDFQVSDYRTIGRIVIDDRLSNGHQFIAGSPTLTITDGFGSYSVPITPNVTTVSNVAAAAGCPSGDLTALSFDVSGRLSQIPSGQSRHQNGILTGGLAPATPAGGPAKGTIVFQARIEDAYKGYDSIDKHDPLCNTVTSFGAVYKNAAPGDLPNALSPARWTRDNSGAKIAIVSGEFSKTIYAVTRGSNVKCGPGAAPCVMGQEVLPGDRVTFRLQYDSIPSGDAESITIKDWLPQPVFALPSGSIPFNTTCSAAPPAVDAAKCGPDNTPGLFPIGPISVGSANDITVTYGTVSDTTNQPKKLDLLFSVRVTNAPFADGLLLTNEARECEDATFVKGVCKVAVTQVRVREPKLAIRKGLIWTDNKAGRFVTPPTMAETPKAPAPANVTFGQAGVSGIVSSANLGGHFQSDLTQIDAGDSALFAIVIENQGGYPAFDVSLEDIGLSDCFEIDPATVKARRGSSSATGGGLAIQVTSGTSAGFKLKLTNQIPTMNQAVTPSQTLPPGANIVIITFKAKMPAGMKAGCCRNTATLTNYASKPGGANFVPTGDDPGYGGPFSGDARICSGPRAAEKCVRATSEAHTLVDSSANGAIPDVAIGEIVRYRLMTVIPEGVTQSLRVTDLLPQGMSFVPGSAKAAFVANTTVAAVRSSDGSAVNIPRVAVLPKCEANWAPNQQIAANPPPGTSVPPWTPGLAPSFPANPITVTNSDSDPDLEYILVDFNARVDNIAVNQNGTDLENLFLAGFDDSYDGDAKPVTSTSAPVSVKVVEPALTVDKSANVTPISGASSVVEFTVKITNKGHATAFDLRLTDNLPVGITLSGLTLPQTCSASMPLLTVDCPSLAVKETIDIKYTALASGCPGPVTNTATVTWTSLPGPMGTQGNPTGSNITAASGAPAGERNGSSPGNEPNNYVTSDSETIACGTPPPPSGGFKVLKRLVNNHSQFIWNHHKALDPSAQFSVTAACGQKQGTIFLLPGDEEIIAGLPLGASCAIQEETLYIPGSLAAAVGCAAPTPYPVWEATYVPASPVAAANPPTDVVVYNKAACTDAPPPPIGAASFKGELSSSVRLYKPGDPAPNDNEAAVLNASEAIRVRSLGAEH